MLLHFSSTYNNIEDKFHAFFQLMIYLTHEKRNKFLRLLVLKDLVHSPKVSTDLDEDEGAAH